MKMLDYIAMAEPVLCEQLAAAEQELAGLKAAFQSKTYTSICIVASGSSRHSALMARPFMEKTLQIPLRVLSPEAYCDYELNLYQDVFYILISQGGESTNVLRAMDKVDNSAWLFCANPESTAVQKAHDLGLQLLLWHMPIETVGFVTLGVHTLIACLMEFALLAKDALPAAKAELLEAFSVATQSYKAALAQVQEEHLRFACMKRVFCVGNGPLNGLAQEFALKLQECLKVAAAYYEVEEYIHGPEMQLVPGDFLFILDDPQSKPRICSIYNTLKSVTANAYLLGSQGNFGLELPKSEDFSIFAYLSSVQTLCAHMAEDLDSWEMHPYLKNKDSALESKCVRRHE